MSDEFGCAFCEKEFDTEKALMQHAMAKHPEKLRRPEQEGGKATPKINDVLEKWSGVMEGLADGATIGEAKPEAPAPQPFKCRANRSADPPQDCDWPLCGCDPYADKVIAALQEDGLLVERTSHPSRPVEEVKYLCHLASCGRGSSLADSLAECRWELTKHKWRDCTCGLAQFAKDRGL